MDCREPRSLPDGLLRSLSVVEFPRRSFRVRYREGHYSYLRPRHIVRLATLYTSDLRGRAAYRVLNEVELATTRSSDTAFVFGSGRSLVEITQEEWEAISRYNTISFREFPRQHWVRADYHITSEVDELEEYAERIRENPLYAETVFVVQGGLIAERGNEIIGRRLLSPGARVFRYRRVARGRYAAPSRTPRALVHGPNSIFDATNLAVALGFRRIVLAGADYYNKEYFWLAPGEKRSYEPDAVDVRSEWGATPLILAMMRGWKEELGAEGVELSVWNPRSRLTDVLPVFDRSTLS
jgi:hypothetical protein